MALGKEIGLRAVATGLAGLSIGFAVYMLAYGGGKVRINSMQDLAIFAQPRGSPLPVPPAATKTVDMASTGSLSLAEQLPVFAPAPVDMVAAGPDRAWVRIGDGIRAVEPGDDIPLVGRIATIASRDGGWALLDANGATLLALKNKANGAALFTRKLIFD